MIDLSTMARWHICPHDLALSPVLLLLIATLCGCVRGFDRPKHSEDKFALLLVNVAYGNRVMQLFNSSSSSLPLKARKVVKLRSHRLSVPKKCRDASVFCSLDYERGLARGVGVTDCKGNSLFTSQRSKLLSLRNIQLHQQRFDLSF